MPYITPERRRRLTQPGCGPQLVGELNYAITKLIDDYLTEDGLAIGVSYSAINEVIGVLECAKLELYRRIAAPYEDTKIAENGDVYSCVPAEPKG